ncbi:hypothetical protein CY35_17G033200 [Sphagnum magellanicum]|nr:hypothetical protein CY35_17G033200 [Sphagnum magellanicum]
MAMSMTSVPSCSCAAAATATAGVLRSAPKPLCTSLSFASRAAKTSRRGTLKVQAAPRRRAVITMCASDTLTMPETGSIAPAIVLTEKALKHLNKLRADQNKDLCLRVGVRQGGCSGMSYVMDFEEKSKLRPDDSVIEHEGFTMVCDPKSLLFLFGMQLDYSDALIGGGFSFSNPNASSTCGCGKSFAA